MSENKHGIKNGRCRDTLKRLVLLDDDGKRTTAGDIVEFSYGIPPILVEAEIIERDGKLIGLCHGHNPPEFNLRSLRRYVGCWYKQNATGERRVSRPLDPIVGQPESGGGNA